MQPDDPEVIEVRAEERFDEMRLAQYLRERLNGAAGDFSVRQFGGGHANLTYLLRFGGTEFVLRRPPLGPVPPHAHDMRREHTVLSVLYRSFPLAPRSYLLCTDSSVIGSDFVVEERRAGIAIRRDVPEKFRSPEVTRGIGEALVDTLALLHRIDPVDAGLVELGRPDGYVRRQFRGWSERWERARTAGTADAAPLLRWLDSGLPQSQAVSIVHNDYKLDNLLLNSEDPARIAAVLDWDMCTLGDPLMDLGYLLALWVEPRDPPSSRAGAMPTWREGFPSRTEATDRYARATGFDVSNVRWYYFFNIFRFAAILQQIYQRFERGATTDRRFGEFGARANGLISDAISAVR